MDETWSLDWRYNMRVQRYSELKAEGKIQLVYEDEKFYLVATKYDEWTGEVIGEKREPIDKDEVIQTKDKLISYYNSLQELISDAQALIGG